MKKYEGLFILNTAGKEETVQEMIKSISAELTAAGCKVQTVQKMDKRPFARVGDLEHSSGFYANFIFEAEPSVLPNLRSRFTLNKDVLRVLFTVAAAPVPVSPVAPAAAQP